MASRFASMSPASASTGRSAGCASKRSTRALEVPLAVQRELQRRFDETDRLRHAQVERALYECDLA